jgi:hypothetical protein
MAFFALTKLHTVSHPSGKLEKATFLLLMLSKTVGKQLDTELCMAIIMQLKLLKLAPRHASTNMVLTCQPLTSPLLTLALTIAATASMLLSKQC